MTRASELDEVVEESDAALLRLLRGVRGIRVQATIKAIESGVAVSRETRGTIVGWSGHRWSVRVLKDGNSTPSSYHVSFWQPLTRRRTPRVSKG